ncbi:MAG: hypothetical protein OXB92_04875 [Acidimicrobiaceae bacterium]|nr:hypothetical protein [Acidimicrobiia bacterium]MCY4493176.1 hypothetical protein [Acidimicrobiaceae bacterium]
MAQRFAERVALATGSTQGVGQGVGQALLQRMAGEGLAGAVVTGRNVEFGP